METAMIETPPLDGITVLDVSQGIAGPYCGALLSRYGANVIKIESPAGDWGRVLGKSTGKQSAISAAYNIGKRSLTLDLKQPDAVALFLDMCIKADLVIESSRPGVAKRIGIDYEQVRKRNPGIVYVSVSGFGQSGIHSDRPCTDTVAQAFSGLMSGNCGTDGIPHKIDIPIIDIFTGLYAFQAASMGLVDKGKTGRGCYCDISLMSAIAEVQAAKLIDYHMAAGQPKTLNAPAGAFKTADGYIALTSINDDHFARICRALDAEHMTSDVRYSTSDASVDNHFVLRGEIEEILATADCDTWVERLQSNDVLADRVNDLGDWMKDHHVRDTEAFALIEQPDLGIIPRPRPPGGVPTDGVAPLPGQHSEEVLREFGLDADQISDLRRSRSVM
jgi:crotonobetainyl-CoA:carnitine CoA-transferase CaiB-like acyl-CoA transferase